MAKALLGYVGGSDPRLLAEMRRLQQRVQDLESELVRIQDENDALNAAAQHQESLLDSIDIDVPQAGKRLPDRWPPGAGRVVRVSRPRTSPGSSPDH